MSFDDFDDFDAFETGSLTDDSDFDDSPKPRPNQTQSFNRQPSPQANRQRPMNNGGPSISARSAWDGDVVFDGNSQKDDYDSYDNNYDNDYPSPNNTANSKLNNAMNDTNGNGNIRKIAITCACIALMVVVLILGINVMFKGNNSANTNTNNTPVQQQVDNQQNTNSNELANQLMGETPQQSDYQSGDYSMIGEGTVNLPVGTVANVSNVRLGKEMVANGVVSKKGVVEIVGQDTYVPYVLIHIAGNGVEADVQYYCGRYTYDALSKGDSVSIVYQVDRSDKIMISKLNKD